MSVDAVLTAAVWDDTAARRVAAHLPVEVVEGATQQRIVDAIGSLIDDGVPVDPTTVMARVRDQHLPGWDQALNHLLELVTSPIPAGTLGWHLDRLQQQAARQRLRTLAGRMSQHADDGDPADVVTLAREQLDRIDLGAASTPPSLADLTESYLQRLETADTTQTLPTGFADLDRMLAGGLRAGQLVVVGGRPAAGKSLLLAGFARAAAARGARSLLHSLEMPRQEVWDRHTASVASVPLDRIVSRRLTDDDWSRIGRTLPTISDVTVHVDDRPSVTVADVTRTARGMRPDLILIDYLQLLRPAKASGSRQEDVAGLSRALKLLARDLRCPVVVAAQLNRGQTQRADAAPRMSDLRESGAIEADADVVLLLHRDPGDETLGTTAQLIVAKNRSGETGTLQLAFLGHYARFGPLTLAGGRMTALSAPGGVS